MTAPRKTKRRPRKAVVLAAGLGTRLRPLTNFYPKPAVPILGLSPLRFTLATLAAGGIEEVCINTHWLPAKLREAVQSVSRPKLSFSHEEEILGTGGALVKLAEWIGEESFVLANGKLVFDVDLEALWEAHRDTAAAATMVLREHPPGTHYASIELDPGGRICRFAGRYEDPRYAGSLQGYVFTGVHLLEASMLSFLPDHGASCINAQGYVGLLQAGGEARGLVQNEGIWSEPSTPSRYLQCVQALLRGRAEDPSFGARFREGGADPLEGFSERQPGVYLHPSAKIGSEVQFKAPVFVGPQAQIGSGALLGPGVVLETGAIMEAGASASNAVLWPGATLAAGETLEEAVLLPNGQRVLG